MAALFEPTSLYAPGARPLPLPTAQGQPRALESAGLVSAFTARALGLLNLGGAQARARGASGCPMPAHAVGGQQPGRRMEATDDLAGVRPPSSSPAAHRRSAGRQAGGRRRGTSWRTWWACARRPPARTRPGWT